MLISLVSVIIIAVAPFTGAWIEISKIRQYLKEQPVAPFTGAWIEIEENGLKHPWKYVAPFTGAWIEIEYPP